mmetsp:Transcript_11550/g.26854  ORF Transcript_11550/g.26854 Transcript_11550/m.26854 type:complete len:150 (+) Transcript_11550:88-537(+)|eukprot:CAMPEP_0178404358 /NCGR_PEP_ID=MMETSP0689_2-20121128/17841_1 /TAXON_ID=160604 /ORGANISM="Amphidinium massartii, Strain CS-259" /LENGTH=149 /DNA_ID=CAMNT_0020025337 /DNA_START=83 /DNA_END=532 /DNA_ORIENTATION=+
MARRSFSSCILAVAAALVCSQLAFTVIAPTGTSGMGRTSGSLVAAQPSTSSASSSTLVAPVAAVALVLGAAGSVAAAKVARKADGDKINNKIDTDSPKVVTNEKLEAGAKKVYCRCWLSEKFPLCDGAHAKHNEATGDNVGPLIVAVEK